MASRRTAATTLEDACAWWRKQVTLKVKKEFVTLKIKKGFKSNPSYPATPATETFVVY